jgi:hypothetical protein
MALTPPKATDLFSDIDSPKAAAVAMDEFNTELSKSLSAGISDPSQIMAVKSGNVSFAQASMSSSGATTQLEALVANKSLSPEVISSLTTALATQRGVSGDIAKEITTTSPLSTSFAAFDLEAPAKLLTPRPTPLRNRIPRKKGIGTSHRVKRILGYTGTGTGGQGQIWPGINETTQNNFAPGASNPYYLERGPQISYTADDLVLPYNSYSLSDQVSFDANFSGLGYQDLRQLSSTSTLYATMLMEERMMLMARGTASGYSGALAAPVFATGARAAAGSEVALTATTYYVNVTADAGISYSGFGESILGTQATQVVASGQVLTVTVSAANAVVGALGYNVYVGTTTGAANLKYQGTLKGTGTLVINGVGGNSLGNADIYTTTGAAASRASADTSAYATGYDGILPTVLGPNSGAINQINSTFSTSNPGVEFQNVFATLYNNVKADPDEILLNGSDRKQLSDAIKSGSTANYRLNIENPGEGGITYGSVVTGLQNEVTGKSLALTVHPWLPQGVSPVLSYTLPIPDTEVSDVWANFLVQDYMGIQWPVNQFTYDFSTYFRGTFFCTAPAWNGVVSGIVPA